MVQLPDFEYISIETNEQLAEYCKHWLECEVLALDTEFVRRSTYYPILGLIQVGDGDNLYLIDPVNIDDYQPFAEVLQCDTVLKLVHSASEDLEIFQLCAGCLPEPLLDTQIAAGMAGVGVGLGFNKLVMALLDIDLPKGETCSDWCQRPLSPQQCQYACADVYYLYAMYPLLRQRLEENDCFKWALADSSTAGFTVPSQVPTMEYYLRVGGATNLTRTELCIFKYLCDWRENKVRKRDMPRGRFVKDAVLLKVARKAPSDLAQLAKIPDVTPGLVRKHGEKVLDIVSKAKALPDDEMPALLPPSLSPAKKIAVEKLKDCLQSTADKLNFPVELLASKKDLVAIVASNHAGQGYKLPPKLLGWREDAVGTALLTCVEDLAP